MPKFVWEISNKGAWRPQLFHGELPREMTMPHNAGHYVVHDVNGDEVISADMQAGYDESVLDVLATIYPAPPPFTGKE